MIAEFIGLKNGEIIRRFKEECSQVDYDEDTILIGVRGYGIKDLSSMYDRIKLIVDEEGWLNKSLIQIDFSSYEIGKEYEVSDNNKTWYKKELLEIDNDHNTEFPFKTGIRGSGMYGWWRFAREVV